jgi:UDP-glucose 4-epimerase
MILITGAAGYIGSHTVHQLFERGEKLVALDNLYSGHRAAIPTGVPFFEGNAGDSLLVQKIIRDHSVDSVIHFAAHLEVEESTRDPIKYYKNNFENSLRLIEECHLAGVKHFIFSSTCAVYGTPTRIPVTEETPLAPITPYGFSKMMTERLLFDLELAKNSPMNPDLKSEDSLPSMNYAVLRYFNVAGAKISGGLGQSTPHATQLIKVASEAISGKRKGMKIYGTDYPTLDGTCIRDYVHVEDLADAHILALNYLEKGGKSDIFNCGYGTGFSVKQVLETLNKLSQTPLTLEDAPRRQGDAIAIFADPTKIKKVLGWKPRYDNLEIICKTSLDWENNRHF